MNPTTDDPKIIGKQFRWVTNRVIKIVNNEGIEKIIDIENGFKDINQDTVPMIDLKYFETNNNCHYYFSPKALDLGHTEERLKKKYQ
jgi:hypothetical protein